MFPVEILPRGDRRRARVSSRFSRDAAREGRVHLGVDIAFKRRSRAPFGGDSPDDPDDDDTPNDPRAGLGFPLYFVPQGTRVYAPEAGRVIRAGRIRTGLRVFLLHDRVADVDAANAACFCHLETLDVSSGQRVREGALLGTVGPAVLGRAGAGRHLHFERRRGAGVDTFGRAVDPEPYLATCEHRGRFLVPGVAGSLVTMATGLAMAAFWPWLPRKRIRP